LVHPDKVEAIITDRNIDWYRSVYTYGEDAQKYWDKNNHSIKGYTGQAWTNTPFFDLDCKVNFERARISAKQICTALEALGYLDATEVYFSGNKGIHILLRTTNKFTPKEVQAICYNFAKDCGVPNDVFDTSVYNVTRIFRIENTKHQDSELFKIPLAIEELTNLSELDIRTLAKNPRFEQFDTVPVDATSLKTKYLLAVASIENNVVEIKKDPNVQNEIDFSDCPPNMRRCFYALEQGYFTPGERHNSVLRLAAHYRGRDFSREHATLLIEKALTKRAARYPDAKEIDKAELEREISEVYSTKWKGGTFSCETDRFLQNKCDIGYGPCCKENRLNNKDLLTIRDITNQYIKYGEEALQEYPKTGLTWIDERVRLRPENFSIINGANGSGKTSMVVHIMETLNAQKMHHAFFSLDMSLPSVMEKLGSKCTHYSPSQIEAAFNIHTKNTTIIEEVIQAVHDQYPFTLFSFVSSASLPVIETTVNNAKAKGIDIRMIFVDYAGRIPGEFDNQYANSTHNALLANDVSKRTKTHIMFLSQVSRENGDHTDPLRTSRVSKDSGAWEEGATAVINVWRPFGSGLQGDDAFMNVYIGKNRSGPLGEMVFKWDGRKGAIREVTRSEFETYRNQCQQANLDVTFDPFIDEAYRDRQEDTPQPSTQRLSESLQKVKKQKENNGQEVPTDSPFSRFKREPQSGS